MNGLNTLTPPFVFLLRHGGEFSIFFFSIGTCMCAHCKILKKFSCCQKIMSMKFENFKILRFAGALPSI